MRSWSVGILGWVLLAVGWLAPAAMAFVHPGIANSPADFDLMQQKVVGGVQPWRDAYDAMPSRLTYVPSAPAAITCAAGPTCTAALPLLNDATAAYEAALRWVVSGETAHATKAIDILNAWATANPPISGDANRLVAVSQYSPRMALAAEILTHRTGSGWLSGDQTAFNTFVDSRILPNLAPTNVNGQVSEKNHIAALGIWARMAWGVYRDNQALYDAALLDAKALIAFYIGSFGHAVVDGFTYETCAGPQGPGGLAGGDLVHSITALGALAAAAEVSAQQGTDDLYAYTDPADGFGLRVALLTHGRWFYYPDRADSTASGWPCQTPFPGSVLGETEVFTPVSWHASFNHYREAVFLSNSSFQGDQIASTSALPWDRLTHAYNVTAAPSLRYAAPTGSGTACTAAAPCLLTEAIANAAPGSTIRLVSGTYTASIDNLPSGLSPTRPTILESATLGSSVTVGADGVTSLPGQATIQHSTERVIRLRPGSRYILIRHLNLTTTAGDSNRIVVTIGDDLGGTLKAEDITLEDLEIQAPTRTGPSACVRSFKGTAAKITLRRVRVHRCGPAVNFSNTGPNVHGLELQGADVVVEDSDVYDNFGRGIVVDDASSTTVNNGTRIIRSRVFGNGGASIILGGGTDQLLTNTVVYHNGSYGVLLRSTARRVLAYANSLYQNSQQTASSFPGVRMEASATGIVRNTISLGHPAQEYDILTTAANVACSDNLSGDASAPANCTGTDLNAVATDVWVDPNHATLASRDFHLKAGSVAKDAGTPAICTSADAAANRCTPAFTLTTFQGPAPDQGAYEVDAPAAGQTVSRYLLNNSVLDDIGPNEGTSTNVTFDATNKIEGTHAALYDAATDRITTPLAGFNRAAFTIAISARPTAFGGNRATYLYGHSSSASSYANRIQIYATETGALAVGLGSSHTTIPNASTLSLNAWVRAVLVVEQGATQGNGTARLYSNATLLATTAYQGLTQIGSSASLGNNGVDHTNGWLGQLDAVIIANDAWGPAEIDADCALYCGTPTGPFTPLALDECELGSVAANVVTCTAGENPDPAVCNTPGDFEVRYDDVLQTTTACSITGTLPARLRLTLAANATPLSVISLDHQPTASQVDNVANGLSDDRSPLILNTCTLSASGMTVQCSLIGAPDPDACQNLANFRITDNCVTVPLRGCALSGATLALDRSVPPTDETVAVALALRDEAQVESVTNGFVPGTPPGE